MLGSVRFTLALLVMLSHVPQNGLPINVGVVAVVCFYFISGSLMRRSFQRFTLNSKTPVISFYIDRVIKLFPQYLLVCWTSFVIIRIFGPPHFVLFLDQQITPLKVILNSLLLPVNYVFEPFVIQAILPHPIIPPAWSLAAEFHFYLLLPLLYKGGKAAWITALCISGLILFASYWYALPAFNTATFAYRYIWGALALFLYGYAFSGRAIHEQRVAWLFWGSHAVLFILLISPIDLPHYPLVVEVVLGVVMALPLWILCTHLKLQSEIFKKMDRLAGGLAYPIFISHNFSFYLVEKISGLNFHQPMKFFFTSLLGCLIISIGLSRLQNIFDAYRITYRGFESLSENKLR